MPLWLNLLWDSLKESHSPLKMILAIVFFPLGSKTFAWGFISCCIGVIMVMIVDLFKKTHFTGELFFKNMQHMNPSQRLVFLWFWLCLPLVILLYYGLCFGVPVESLNDFMGFLTWTIYWASNVYLLRLGVVWIQYGIHAIGFDCMLYVVFSVFMVVSFGVVELSSYWESRSDAEVLYTVFWFFNKAVTAAAKTAMEHASKPVVASGAKAGALESVEAVVKTVEPAVASVISRYKDELARGMTPEEMEAFQRELSSTVTVNAMEECSKVGTRAGAVMVQTALDEGTSATTKLIETGKPIATAALGGLTMLVVRANLNEDMVRSRKAQKLLDLQKEERQKEMEVIAQNAADRALAKLREQQAATASQEMHGHAANPVMQDHNQEVSSKTYIEIISDFFNQQLSLCFFSASFYFYFK